MGDRDIDRAIDRLRLRDLDRRRGGDGRGGGDLFGVLAWRTPALLTAGRSYIRSTSAAAWRAASGPFSVFSCSIILAFSDPCNSFRGSRNSLRRFSGRGCFLWRIARTRRGAVRSAAPCEAAAPAERILLLYRLRSEFGLEIADDAGRLRAG